MAFNDAILNKVAKYGKLIKRKEKIAHALSRLNDLEMTLDILSATNIGRCVNKLCHDPIYGHEASRIIEKWKEVARQSGVRGDEDSSSSEDNGQPNYDQSPIKEECSSEIRKGSIFCDDERRGQSQERCLYSSSDVDVHDYNKYHNIETAHHQEHSRENRTYLCDLKKNYYSGDQDSKGYRHQLDDKDKRKSRSESSRNTYEDYHKSHDKNEYSQQEQGKWACAEDDEINLSPVSRSPVWSERAADDQSDNELMDVNEEYRSGSEKGSKKMKALDTNGEQKSYRNFHQRHSSSNVDHIYKRKRSPSEESTTPKLELKSKSDAKQSKKSKCKKVVTDFETMLLSADSSPVKIQKPREALWKYDYGNVPILNNYHPFPQAARAPKETSSLADNFNPENMFKPRNERGKVFAGRRKVVSKDVLSLFHLCLRVLMNNTRVLLYAEYISYDVAKPILEKCTAKELSDIEAKHRDVMVPVVVCASDLGNTAFIMNIVAEYLEEDSEELWQRFVEKKSQEKNRTAMLADATAPTYIKRRQMRHGTNVSKSLPSAQEVSSARRKIFESGGSKDSLAAIPNALVRSSITVNAKGDSKKQPVKKGALMIKTMKMLKMKRK
ncbi:transcription elongation factor S-II protein [Dictyocaulus viviparus]|uniref:Transcription elongation factor S-II protein n=1 Tax=Dictyocaulus viviparus TaxID=29172 RepID=A0A0D8XS73_DICVI|nr:transcription elongation factor S-II protein [Dictyocaulus viviparus]